MFLYDVHEAANLLIQGKVVAIPTETVYGLAAHGYQAKAIREIYTLKNRPLINPLILHYSSLETIQKDVRWTSSAQVLAKAFWPGPLTLVLEQSSSCSVPKEATAGLSSLAVRVPSHPIVLDLLKACSMPLAAPSANPSGCLSPTTSHHVRTFFKGPILEGGPCLHGLESTIIDCRQAPRLLRPGAIPLQDIETVLGMSILSYGTSDQPQAPGALSGHYAPQKPLRLNAREVHSHEGLLAFGPPLEGAYCCIQLSLEGNLTQAAAKLFSALHSLDESSCESIAVMPIPYEGIGIAINDRLSRAAYGSVTVSR